MRDEGNYNLRVCNKKHFSFISIANYCLLNRKKCVLIRWLVGETRAQTAQQASSNSSNDGDRGDDAASHCTPQLFIIIFIFI